MSLSFNLEVTFTGICAFFTNANSAGLFKICMVMPGGVDGYEALDGELLCRHDSYLFTSIDSDSRQLPPIDLKNTRVIFDDQGTSNTTVGPPVPPATSQQPATVIDLNKVIDPTQYRFDPGIVSHDPPRIVNSQVLLSYGVLSTTDSTDLWDIAGVAGGKGISKACLAHSVIWTADSLTSLTLNLVSFRGTNRQIDLSPVRAETIPPTVRLSIVNSCKDIPDLPLVQAAYRDRDFKWYFELLQRDGAKGRKNLRDLLRTSQQDLPIPRYHSAGPLVGGGADCYLAAGGALPFD